MIKTHNIKFTILTTFNTSAVLNIFTLLCSQYPELYHLAKLKLCTHETTPIFPYPHLIATTVLFSVFLNLTTLGTSYKWIKDFFNLRFSFCCWKLPEFCQLHIPVLLSWTDMRRYRHLGDCSMILITEVADCKCSCQWKQEASIA